MSSRGLTVLGRVLSGGSEEYCQETELRPIIRPRFQPTLVLKRRIELYRRGSLLGMQVLFFAYKAHLETSE
jgi:hypothetical protein